MSEPNEFERACGLSHSLRHLDEMTYRITQLSREEQAGYADAVTRHYATSSCFIDQQFGNIDLRTLDYSKMNTTSVGNIAYMLLHSPLTEEQREKCEGLLKGYSEYLSTQSTSGPSGCAVA